MSEVKIHTIDLDFLGQKNGIAAYVLETDEGPVLVESGPHSTLSVLTAGLNDLGYKISDIQHVFITHIHLDHAGAAWCFAEHGAKVYLHPRGFKHMKDPSRLLTSAKMIYKEKMDALWGTLKPIPEEQLIVVDHLDIVTIGSLAFKAHHTPGHAQHHIAWQLGNDLFTGDVAGVCINRGPVIPPCPPPDINREDWLSSIEHILTLKEIDTYYLTHFGAVNNLKEHMNQLREAIEAYVGFAAPYAKEGKSVSDMLPDFRTFVREYLVNNGLTQADAAAYEAANPSDMSATGLLRYWRKRFEHS